MDVTVYPNPAQNLIIIRTNDDTPLQRIDLYDVTGQLIISSTETEINVSELESGIYFVSILTEKGAVTKKISVVR